MHITQVVLDKIMIFSKQVYCSSFFIQSIAKFSRSSSQAFAIRAQI